MTARTAGWAMQSGSRRIRHVLPRSQGGPSSGPVVVYLDQNKWIELARMRLERSNARGTAAFVDELVSLVARGTALFPLSLGHYQETFRQSNPQRRHQLAQTMFALAGL